jgi:predicted nucleic acid-binding protein
VAAFLDTNILLYAFAETSEGDTRKAIIARDLIDRLTLESNFIVSAQVLSEFSHNAAKKGKLVFRTREIQEIVETFAQQIVVAVDASLVLLALQRVEQNRISYWDALIVEAAIRSGATVLYTEDMHHGTCYGTLELRNPFLS